MRLIIALLFFMLTSFPVFGNDSLRILALIDSAAYYSESSDIDKSLLFLESASKLALQSKLYIKYIECNKLKTFTSLSKGNIDLYFKHLKSFETTIIDYKRYLGNDSLNYLSELIKGKIYFYGMIGDFKKSVTLLKEQYTYQCKIIPNKPKSIFYTLLNIAGMEMQIGNFEVASQYYQKALSHQETYFKDDHLSKLMTYQLLGVLNWRIKNYKKAELFYKKALIEKDLTKTDKSYILKDNQIIIGKLFFEVSNNFGEQMLFDLAKMYLDSSFLILKKYNSSEVKLYRLFNSKSKILFNTNKFNSAYEALIQSKNLIEPIFGKKHYQIAQILFEQSKIHQKTNKLGEAVNSSQSALIALSQTFESKDWRDNPSVSEVFSKKDLLEILDFKAGLLLDLAKKQPEYLQSAYNTAQLAVGLIDTIRADYTSDFDKQYLAEWSYGVYEKAINSAYLLYQKTHHTRYIATAFNALERSKAIVLLEALKTGQAESALSDDDRNKLYQLKAELQKLETQIYDETTKNKKKTDDPSVRALQNRLFDTRRQYEVLVKGFETLYPDYYKVKFNQNFVQLKDLQNLLPKNGSTVALEYFVGDKDIYTFLITQNNCQIFKKEKPTDFESRIEALRHALTWDNAQSSTLFINQATWLYDLILKDPLSIDQKKVKKLIIMPDGILSYVPFEMLFDGASLNQNRWSDLPFLVKKYVISYANSSNLLSQQMQRKAQGARQLFAGFAAQYKPNDAPMMAMRAALTRDSAYDLPYAQREVTTIQALVGGTLFTQSQSTEQNFKEKANQFRILHFAMHAVPDSLNPTLSKLLFTFNAQDTLEDNDLTAAELYAMQLKADLAILSACQTGYGKINRGEGVMSLSRAFAYAGVPATVVSLWKVPDNTTQEIMISFYKNLKAGQTKDEALSQAKLTYLSNHAESDELQNPFYWAGFVAVGNMESVDMSSPYQRLWIVSFVLLVFVVSTLWMRHVRDN